MTRSLIALLAAAVICSSLAKADEPAKKIDPAKLEELKQKFAGQFDPAKLQELKDKFGKKGQAANVDPEALFKKYADKDGKLSLDDFKKLFDELKGKMAGGAAGRFGNFDPAKLQELKEKFKNKQQ